MNKTVLGFLLYVASGNAYAQMPPVEHFARLPLIRNVEVSSNGQHFAAMVAPESRYLAMVYAYGDDGIENLFGAAEDDDLSVRRFRWVGEDRLVMSVGFKSNRYGTDTVESRLLGVGLDSEMKPLFRKEKGEMPVQFEDNIVSWVDQDPEHILVQYRDGRNARYPSVMKVPTADRDIHRTIQLPIKGIGDWYADIRGTVRAGRGFKDESENERKFIIRLNKDDKWRDISHRVADAAPDFVLRGFSERENIAYVESGHQYDPPALYEYDIATDSFPTMLFHDESAEIGGLYLDSITGALRGVGYGEEASAIKWLDNTLQAEITKIRALYPGKAVSLINESIDQKTAVYDISGLADPGRYFIFSRDKQQLYSLPPLYPELETHALATMIATSYVARDGLNIPAYVTLPAGVTSMNALENAPFVILPHGGPTARDFLRFDYLSQFLASRGYAVLQMNFRGSAGYGQEFRDAGKKEWGQAMQDDITDGAQWLIDSGYASRDKVAILGGSYGGYAALMGAVKTPDLYQCAVSIAGVSDLPDLVRSKRDYIGGRAGTRHIGNLWKDRSKLQENSPSRRAEEIQIPILLIHGEEDRVVDVKQSKEMNRALKRKGKDVRFIELENGDHYLSLYANRLKALQEVEAFLGGCLS